MRKLAIAKRVDLSAVADGWDGCYALVMPATYAEYLEFATLADAGKSNAELLQYQLDFTKKHVVGGKVNVLDDSGAMSQDDLQPEDIDQSKELADELFTAIVGVAPDPKGSSPATTTSSTSEATSESSNSTNSTKTQ